MLTALGTFMGGKAEAAGRKQNGRMQRHERAAKQSGCRVVAEAARRQQEAEEILASEQARSPQVRAPCDVLCDIPLKSVSLWWSSVVLSVSAMRHSRLPTPTGQRQGLPTFPSSSSAGHVAGRESNLLLSCSKKPLQKKFAQTPEYAVAGRRCARRASTRKVTFTERCGGDHNDNECIHAHLVSSGHCGHRPMPSALPQPS
jgi:hypothetical protein